jgi:hypothetical protein
MLHQKFYFHHGLITKFLCKTKVFAWTIECQEAWEAIKQKYQDTLILITPKWDMEFHIHTDASNLVIEAMLVQNPIEKCDQPIAYASKFINNAKKTTPPLKGKYLLWFMFCINSDIIYLETSLFSTSTTWHCYTL